MRDLAFTFYGDTAEFDLSLKNWDLAYDEGLETAILISLFSDARVDVEELRPGESDRKGFWADAVVPAEGKNTGSKLWLLDRGKITDETLEQARDWCIEALNWLLEDGIASDLDVEVTRVTGRNDAVLIDITVVRPGDEEFNFKYDYVWGVRASGVRKT